MRLLLLILLFISTVQGDQTLKIATYNVENLFDLKKSGHEYREYIPNGRSHWNLKNYKIKLNNITKVIKDVDADVIALEEIESLQALKDLRLTLKQKGLYYQYYAIANYKQTTVKVALLSKIPFVYAHEIAIKSSYRYRDLLEVKFRLHGHELYLLANHWKAKSGPESMRIVSARKVMKRVREIGESKNIILLGDFNSDYEENILFKRKRKLNDTDGMTGINDILGSKYYKKDAKNVKVDKGDFYNLWYDTYKQKRFSYIFRGKKEAMDNILVSPSLLNNKGISYKHHSISSFKAPYLFRGKYIYRWQVSRRKPHIHKGKGYSDHLPVTAEFVVH